MPSLPYKTGRFFIMINRLKREFPSFSFGDFEQCIFLTCIGKKHKRYLSSGEVSLCASRGCMSDNHSFKLWFEVCACACVCVQGQQNTDIKCCACARAF